MSLVVRPPDALFLPPSIVPKWRGLRGLVIPHLRRQLREDPRLVVRAVLRELELVVLHDRLHHALANLEKHGERASVTRKP